MEDTGNLFLSYDLLECGRLYKESLECFEKVKSKKQHEECLKIHKKYQFCLANAETEKLEKERYWRQFKDKWGHFPNEVIENPKE